MNQELIISYLKRDHDIIKKDVNGVTDEQALTPLLEGGSHMHWLVGHLVAGRDTMLAALGAERIRSAEDDAPFNTGSAPATAGSARPFAELVAEFDRSQDALIAALEAATPEQLAKDAGRFGTVADTVAFMVWHEAYHVGQATLYRRGVGLDSPLP